ncbi:hypothetical protein [Pediococcus pentosaceus]|uniref:hypothetical protein n=1 Tax=Pediococcus pentosaceus TaxID=1255 RepID=UPI002F269F4A
MGTFWGHWGLFTAFCVGFLKIRMAIQRGLTVFGNVLIFNTELAKLDEYIANFEEIYGISLDPLQRKKFAYWLAITLERSQIAPLNMKIAKKQIIDNDPNFDLMWQWNKKGELTLNQDELYFLYQVIYVFGIIDGNPNYENSYASAHQKNQTHAYQAVMNLALVIKKTFNFQLGTTDLELMFNFIAFHERSTFFMEILTCFSTVPT